MTRVFVPNDYGIMELTGTVTALLSLFLTLGIDSATVRSYFDCSTQEQKKTVVSTGFWFLVGWNLLVIPIIILCSDWISLLVFNDVKNSYILKVAFLSMPLSLLIAYCQIVVRLHFAPWKYTAISLFSSLFSVSLSLLLVLKFNMGLIGYFGGAVLGYAISLAPALYLIRGDLAPRFSPHYIREMFAYGGPLVFAGLSYYIFTMSNRLFLAKFGSLAEVGLYAIANKLNSVIMFFYLAFSLAWTPFLLKIYAESEMKMKEILPRALKYVVICFSLLAVVISTFAREVLHFLTPEQYFGAVIAIPALCIGSVAYASTQGSAIGISITRKTKYLALSSWIVAALNVAFNFLLVPNLGILGASIANALSYIALTVLYFVFAQKLYRVNFDMGALVKILLICSAFAVTGNLIVIGNLVLALFLKTCFVVLFIGALFLFKVFDNRELGYIGQSLSDLRKLKIISALKNCNRTGKGEKK